jgi:hypothetical protein
MHDGSSMGAGELKFFKKIKIKIKIEKFKMFFQKKFNPPLPQQWLVALSHFNPPTLTEEPSCTTAPPWGPGD